MNGATLKQSKGVGLIEVLITMLILSTTLITLAALQTRSLQYNHGAYLGSQANILASDILDRIRANKKTPGNAVQIANYNVAASAFTASAVPTTSVADADVYLWRQTIHTQMPGAQGSISCDNTSMICTVIISWNEVNNELAGRLNEIQFEYSTRL